VPLTVPVTVCAAGADEVDEVALKVSAVGVTVNVGEFDPPGGLGPPLPVPFPPL
jgi:hypothetical protein